VPESPGTWAEYVAEPEFDESLVYAHLGEFARHVVEQMKAGATGEFAAVFDAVERLHVDGDEYVREAATIGLLEDLQNVAGHAGVDRRPGSAGYAEVERLYARWQELEGIRAGTSPKLPLEDAEQAPIVSSGLKGSTHPTRAGTGEGK
jgi:hypothetical protein